MSLVLDASAVLAMLIGEPGHEEVRDGMRRGAFLSSVNLAEVYSKLCDRGTDRALVDSTVEELCELVEIVSFDQALSLASGRLRSGTRKLGLSLGDRACLALAAQLGLPVLTTDNAWAGLTDGPEVRVIR